MTESTEPLVEDAEPVAAQPAGALLRAGREAAGLSIATVAQQLKLAPRQVFFAHMILMDSDSGHAFCLGRTYIITRDKLRRADDALVDFYIGRC